MLALEYRPKTLDDLVGQSAAQKILRQMIGKKDMPGALLFAGPRGSGKTSSARILSASLNCEEDHVPCGSCTSCKEIFDGSSMVCLEIDAASKGNVEDVRRLISLVQYELPDRWRVIIIDECHNLSRDAWNALLKTLEEPPHQHVFILVTTEEDRVPDTILSRAMRIPFSKVPQQAIIDRLAHIAKSEGIVYEDVALDKIAFVSDGGMRDAIMIMEQIGVTSGEITLEAYENLFGADDTEFYLELDQMIAIGKVAEADQLLTSRLRTVADPTVLIDNWSEVERRVLLALVGANDEFSQDQLKWYSVKTVLGRMVALWEVRSRVRYLGLKGQTLLKLTVLIMAGKKVEAPELPVESLEELAAILS